MKTRFTMIVAVIAYNGTVCIDLPGECGTGAIGRPGEGSQGGGNYGAPTN